MRLQSSEFNMFGLLCSTCWENRVTCSVPFFDPFAVLMVRERRRTFGNCLYGPIFASLLRYYGSFELTISPFLHVRLLYSAVVSRQAKVVNYSTMYLWKRLEYNSGPRVDGWLLSSSTCFVPITSLLFRKVFVIFFYQFALHSYPSEGRDEL